MVASPSSMSSPSSRVSEGTALDRPDPSSAAVGPAMSERMALAAIEGVSTARVTVAA